MINTYIGFSGFIYDCGIDSLDPKSCNTDRQDVFDYCFPGFSHLQFGVVVQCFNKFIELVDPTENYALKQYCEEQCEVIQVCIEYSEYCTSVTCCKYA